MDQVPHLIDPQFPHSARLFIRNMHMLGHATPSLTSLLPQPSLESDEDFHCGRGHSWLRGDEEASQPCLVSKLAQLVAVNRSSRLTWSRTPKSAAIVPLRPVLCASTSGGMTHKRTSFCSGTTHQGQHIVPTTLAASADSSARSSTFRRQKRKTKKKTQSLFQLGR